MKDQLIHYQAEARCSLKRIQEIAVEIGEDFYTEDFMRLTNRVYNALEGMANLTLKSEESPENELVCGLTEDGFQKIYQAHHLAIFLAVMMGNHSETVNSINSETLSVVFGLVHDLTDLKQIKSLSLGNKKPA